MHKKAFLIALGIAFLLLAIGSGVFVMTQSKKTASQQANDSDQSAQPISSESSELTSIKEALLGGAGYVCDFTDKEGRKTLSYIKKGKIRANITSPNKAETGSIIMKDKTMYFWNDNKEAFKITFSQDYEQMINNSAGSNDANQQERILRDLEEYKEYCQQQTVDDGLFVQPANLEFTDMSSLMKAADGQTALPTVSEEQLEQLMQKYAPTGTN